MQPMYASPRRLRANRIVFRLASLLLILVGIALAIVVKIDYGNERATLLQLGGVVTFGLTSWLIWHVMRGFFQHLVLFVTIGGLAITMILNWNFRHDIMGYFWAGLVVVVSGCVFMFWPVDDNDEVYFRGGGGYIGYREVTGGDN